MELSPYRTHSHDVATVLMALLTESPATDGGGGSPTQVIAQRLAKNFNVSADEIIALHQQGSGFGAIARALLLARQHGHGAKAADFLPQASGG